MKADEVVDELKRLTRPERALAVAQFFKAEPGGYSEGDQFLGIPVPEQRAVARAFRGLPLAEIACLLGSPLHECRLTALLTLVDRFQKGKTGRDEAAKFYLKHIDRVNNWDLVDTSAPHILGTWLLTRPVREQRGILGELARSGLLWRQRVAMVACLAFVRAREFEVTVEVADLLRHHPHDLIHKAVGWVLREMGKRDEAALVSYLGPRYRDLPRTCLRYAIEKFSPERRRAYLLGEA